MIKFNVSSIQHCSLGDGDGIRTTVFLKGCNLRCPWCHNPETVSPRPVTLTYKQTGKTVTYGREMTVDELICELLEDKEFYFASGGGVTVSGGEPMLQADGIAALGEALLREGVSLFVDTAGCVPWSSFEKVLPYVDCYYFDLKSADEAGYCEVVGGDLVTVVENLSRLLSLGKRLHVRVPLIPGFNADPGSAGRMCTLLSSVGAGRVDLLPFHRMASSKYDAMGMRYSYADTNLLSEEKINEIADIFKQNFTIRIEK